MIAELHLPQADRFKFIAEKIPGYSGFAHYLFFESLLWNHPEAKSLLLLGVYQGRDLAFILDSLKRHRLHPKFDLIGVDKFNDQSSTDWAPELKGKTWEEAGYGTHPEMAKTQANLEPFCFTNVRPLLVQSDDAKFLEDAERIFDIIYLDTAHDYDTVDRQLLQIRKLCHGKTVVCGDDYRDNPNWGVKEAVRDNFKSWQIWDNQIWYASSADFK